MARVLLFHSSVGQTPGFLDLAEQIRAAGHTVTAPDLFAGRTFAGPEDGMAHVEELGGLTRIVELAVRTAEGLPEDVVYTGVSMGVPTAQKLAQTRPGARGAVFLEACLPPDFAGSWPTGVPVQIHGMDRTRTSPRRATSTTPVPWSRRPGTANCLGIRATATCSPAAACRPTTPMTSGGAGDECGG